MTDPPTLTHAPNCATRRCLDRTEYPDGVLTLHCVDCAAHAAFTPEGRTIPTPTVVGPLAGARPWDAGVEIRPTEGGPVVRSPLLR